MRLSVAALALALPLQAQQPPPQAARRPARRPARAAAPAARAVPAVRWQAVSAAPSHTCALDVTGQAWCWGDNQWHRLGIEDSVNKRQPVKVATPQRFAFISAGAQETCALTSEGSGVCWGGDFPGTLPRSVLGDRRFASMELGGHTCGVTSDARGWCWGANTAGQLGIASEVESAPRPMRVAGGLRWLRIEPAISGFTCAIADDGTAFCWGGNTHGQVGSGRATGSRQPVAVQGAPTYGQIAVGAEHACGLDTVGRAWCWGRGAEGALGTGRRQSVRAPAPVQTTILFRELVAGLDFSCGIARDNGRALCWGSNRYGVLGTGNTQGTDLPARVAGDLEFTTLSAGTGHVCGISGGVLYCWGDNADGQLGIGRTQTCRNEVAPGRIELRQCALVPTRVADARP